MIQKDIKRLTSFADLGRQSEGP